MLQHRTGAPILVAYAFNAQRRAVCSLPALANTHWPLKSSAMMRLLERDKRFKPTFVYPSLLEAQNRAGQPLVRARVSGFCRV